MSPPAAVVPELEASVLGVLVNAESTRSAAAALLDALRPLMEGASVAIAARGRDGTSTYVLAEMGAPSRWPDTLSPRMALSSEPAVDPATNCLVVPLYTHARVCGVLMFGDSAVGSELLRSGPLSLLLGHVAEVLHVLLARTDAEVRRRGANARSIDAVIEGMAHQISNPLTGAAAMAEMLESEVENAEQRAAVSQIRHELGRAFGVVSDLLAFQRDTRAHDGILDLNAIAERAVRFRGYMIREQGIALELHCTSTYVPVRADARGLEHALLVALRFAELQSHGTVNRSILVRVMDDRERDVSIDIIDSGPGRAPALAPLYFDLPFDVDGRADEAEENPDLGLVDGILRACGGSLEVTSSKTDGTTLSLVLPRAQLPSKVSNGRKSS